MRVVVDSNAIISSDWNLDGPYTQVLAEAVARNDIELLIPEVVVAEVVGAHGRHTEEAIDELDKTQAKLRSLLGPSAPEASVADATRYALTLWRRLSEIGVRQLPIPEVPHMEVVTRAVERRPPFDSSGKDGYRDALIWHNLIEEAKSQDAIVFVTNDSDFALVKERRLRHELELELSELGIDPDRITVAVSLREVAQKVVEPSTQIIGDLTSRMNIDPSWAQGFMEALSEVARETANLVDDTEVHVVIEEDGEPYEDGLEDTYLDDLGDLREASFEAAWPIAKDQFLVEIRAKSQASYSISVDSHVFMRPGVPLPPPGTHFSPGEETATFSGSADVILVFVASYDPKTKSLGRPDLERLASDAG